MGNYPSKVAYHSNALVGDSVFVWGGYRLGLPLVHDSAEKRQFTASVDVFNLLDSSFVKRQTTGTPHTGTMYYSCCNVDDDIYYFGGRCNDNCYHNNLCVLNTTNGEWREITCSDGPMEKSGCGMIPFSDDGEDYLLVIGGGGPLPANTPAHSQYTPFPRNPLHCYTNEIHIMCISTVPGEWTVPKKSGCVFPPSEYFSIDIVSGGNKAIIFGGVCVTDQKRIATNDVFIMSYTSNSVDIQKLAKPLDPFIQWPMIRGVHSSVVISSTLSTGVMKHYLLVLGGMTVRDIVPDCWIMDIENKKWKQITLPESVTKRCDHSVTSFKMSINCVWLLITGGGITRSTAVASPNTVILVELVFSSGNEWEMSMIMNQEDMNNTAQCTKLVFDRLSEFRKEYQMMERTVPEVLPVTEVEELLKQQLKEKDQELEEEQHRLQHHIHQNEETIQQKEATIQQNEATIQQHEANQNRLQHRIRQNEEIIQQKESTIRQKEATIRQKEATIQQKIAHQNRLHHCIHQNEEALQQKEATIRQNEATIQQHETHQNRLHHRIHQNEENIRQKDDTIRQNEATIQDKDVTIQQKDDTIQQKEATIQRHEAEIADLQNQLENRPWILQGEEVEMTDEKIGGGAYGEVKVAIFRGTRVAAKCVHEIIVSPYNISIFTREMDISSKIHHPNIVQFIGATRVDNPILLYELMATSLYNKLQNGESLTRPQITEICCDIASALCYLHQWRPDPIIHRDVSSPNVLMEPLANNRWRSKLSDFGSASLQLHVKTVIPGNPAYSAPEAIIPQHHTPAMDVYSFGILATEMTLHSAPEIDISRRERRTHRIDWIPMKMIVLNCTKNDRNERLTSVELLKELRNIIVYSD